MLFRSWALTVNLANSVTPATVGAYCKYMRRLVGSRSEYVALSLKLMTARDPALQANKDWIEQGASSPLGRLMMEG